MDLNISETRLRSQVQCTQRELRFMICISSTIYWDGEVVVCCNTKQQLQVRAAHAQTSLAWHWQGFLQSECARHFFIELFHTTISHFTFNHTFCFNYQPTRSALHDSLLIQYRLSQTTFCSQRRNFVLT